MITDLEKIEIIAHGCDETAFFLDLLARMADALSDLAQQTPLPIADLLAACDAIQSDAKGNADRLRTAIVLLRSLASAGYHYPEKGH